MQERERRILNYWLVEELGHDRLGQVFRAEEARADRTVVLRLLRVAGVVPQDRLDAAREALRRRIRHAAAIAHPAIATIFELTGTDELDVVAIEDVHGPTLLELGTRRTLPPLDAVLWHAREIAAGIEAAHARGIPHGRISPANVRMARDGRARLLDLGIPRPTEVAYHGGGPDAEASASDMRRDVHALARTIQFMVTGDAEATRRDAARLPGLSGAIVRAVADVIGRRDTDIRQLREALVEVARQTPADAVALTRPAPQTPPPRARPDPVRAPVPIPEPPAAVPEAKRDPPVEPAPAPEPSTGPPILVPEPRRRRSIGTRVAAALHRARGRAADRLDKLRSPAALRFAGAALAGVVLVFGGLAVVRVAEDDGPPVRPAEAAAELAADAPAPAPRDAAPAPAVPPDAAPAMPPQAAPSAPAPAPSPAPAEPPDVGALRVSVSPAGALVSLDGGPWRPAPVSFIDLPAGLHRVRIQRPGFAVRSDTVTVRPGATTRRTYELEGLP